MKRRMFQWSGLLIWMIVSIFPPAIAQDKNLPANPPPWNGFSRSTEIEKFFPGHTVPELLNLPTISASQSLFLSPQGVEEAWARWEGYQTTSQEQIFPAIHCDGEGNVYAASAIYRTGHGMDIYLVRYDSLGNRVWETYWDNTAHSDDVPGKIVTDEDGYLYLAGQTVNAEGEIQLMVQKYSPQGELIRTNFLESSHSFWDIFRFYYLPDGDFYLLTKNYSKAAFYRLNTSLSPVHYFEYVNPNYPIYPRDMRLNRTANRIGMVCITQSPATLTVVFDTTGQLVWEREYIPENNEETFCQNIAIDDSGNVYISAKSSSSSPYNPKMLLVRYQANGQKQWEVLYRKEVISTYDFPTDLHTTGDGFIYLSGEIQNASSQKEPIILKFNHRGEIIDSIFTSQLTFNTVFGVRQFFLQDKSYYLVFNFHSDSNPVRSSPSVRIQKYSATDSLLWETSLVPNQNQGYLQYLVAAVNHQGGLSLLGRAGDSSVQQQFVSSLDTSGTELWRTYFSGALTPQGRGFHLTAEQNGSIYISGFGHTDHLILHYSGDGSLVWQITDSTRILTIYTDNAGHLFVLGWAGSILQLSRYSEQGAREWTISLPEDCVYPYHTFPAVDPEGNLFLSTDVSSTDSAQTICFTRISPNGTVLWSRRLELDIPDYRLRISKLCLDKYNNPILVALQSAPNDTLEGLRLIKMSSGGTLLYNQLYRDVGNYEKVTGVESDGWGNLYLSALNKQPEFAYYWIIDLLKINPEGSLLWKKSIEPPGVPFYHSALLSVNSNGAPILAINIYQESQHFIQLYRFSPSGKLIWEKSIQSVTLAEQLRTDQNNNIYLGGNFIDFSYGKTILQKYTDQGEFRWSTTVSPSPQGFSFMVDFILSSNNDPVILSNVESVFYNWSMFGVTTFHQTGSDSLTATFPSQLTLYPNYPNPFNRDTRIRFSLPEQAEVTMELFDALGRRVMKEHLGQLAPGPHSYYLRMVNYASGVYYFRVQAGDQSRSRKILLLK